MVVLKNKQKIIKNCTKFYGQLSMRFKVISSLKNLLGRKHFIKCHVSEESRQQFRTRDREIFFYFRFKVIDDNLRPCIDELVSEVTQHRITVEQVIKVQFSVFDFDTHLKLLETNFVNSILLIRTQFDSKLYIDAIC